MKYRNQTRWDAFNVCQLSKAVLCLALLFGLSGSVRAAILQDAGATYIAWEAENQPTFANSGVGTWAVTDDVNSSGGGALQTLGSDTSATPSSTARWTLIFQTAGTYHMYLKYHAAYVAEVLHNSYRFPNRFGNLPPTDAGWTTSIANGDNDTTHTDYTVIHEGTNATAFVEFTVASGDVGIPLIFTIGTREAPNFTIDRIVLSTDATLDVTSSGPFDALINSPSNQLLPNPAPLSVDSPFSPSGVRVTFGAPMNASATNPANYTLNNGETVSGAAYGASSNIIQLTVSPALTAGTTYTLTVGNVSNIDGTVINPNPLATNFVRNSIGAIAFQDTGADYIAWEGEAVYSITNDPTATDKFVVTNDATASGTSALYQTGNVNTTDVNGPRSFASFALKFKTPGTYTLYYRWRVLQERYNAAPDGGNSFFIPEDFGEANPTRGSGSNNILNDPSEVAYHVFMELNRTYTVTQAQVDAGLPLIFKIGTREFGQFLDRFALSLDASLTEASFNALLNSGDISPPTLTKAGGSATLTTVTVTFSKPLLASSVSASHFSISGGLGVSSATLDTTTSKDVVLTTAAQTPGTSYTITVNDVTDVNGNVIVANSTVSFTAWQLASGWVTRQLYYSIPGASVTDLQSSPKFPNTPDQVDFLRGLGFDNTPYALDYGIRLTAYFVPPQDGAYEFYMYSDDEAVLSLSTSESPVGLQPLLTTAGGQSFDASITALSGNLLANHRYFLEVLQKQDVDDSRVAVAARLQGTTGPVESLLPLSGSLITTFVNPDLIVTFAAQPTNTSASAGSRATFSVRIAAPSEGLYYQWQVAGVDIPGANRATYVTPVLTSADNGKVYRCVVSVGGRDVSSQAATLTATPGQPSNLQPYIGVNFVGGGAVGSINGGLGGVLTSNDVAGVVPQERFNNVFGTSVADAPLSDATGAPTPVTVSFEGTGGASGSGDLSGDRALLHGYIFTTFINGGAGLVISLAGVPDGVYNLIVYAAGINYANAMYQEDISLTGLMDYPTYTVRGQQGQTFADQLIRASSVDPLARDLGNYVLYEAISPAADGSLTLGAIGQPNNAINGLQLVKVLPVTVLPTITSARNADSVIISWAAEAAGFTLESTTALGPGANWTAVSGVPNPLTGAGNFSAAISANSSVFYRLKK